LPRGEIDIALHRATERSTETTNLAVITDLVMDYKTKKLKGRGINMLPEPDVPVAAGMDRLYETLDKVRLLLQPEATHPQPPRPPKAILLWGIPGTGKSLAAKLAAKHIGGTLVSADWNGLVGRTVQESMQNLEQPAGAGG
jgi:signal recognition particle GTPase